MIADAITETCFGATMAMLSFMEVGDERVPGDPLRKLREVDTRIGLRTR